MRHPHKIKTLSKKKTTPIILSLEEHIKVLMDLWPTLYYDRYEVLNSWFFTSYHKDSSCWKEGKLQLTDLYTYFSRNEIKRHILSNRMENLRENIKILEDNISFRKNQEFKEEGEEPHIQKYKTMVQKMVGKCEARLSEIFSKIEELGEQEASLWFAQTQRISKAKDREETRMETFFKNLNNGEELTENQMSNLGFPAHVYFNSKSACHHLPDKIDPEFLALLRELIQFVDANTRHFSSKDVYEQIKEKVSQY